MISHLSIDQGEFNFSKYPLCILVLLSLMGSFQMGVALGMGRISKKGAFS